MRIVMRNPFLPTSAAAIVAFGLFAACGQRNDTGLFEVSLASGTAVSPSMAPAQLAEPAEPVLPVSGAQLLVTIRQVRIHVGASDSDETTNPVGGPPGLDEGKEHAKNGHAAEASEPSEADSDHGAGWFTVFSGTRRLDLFDTPSTQTFLGAVPVPVGRVTQLRLVIADDVTYVSAAGSVPVFCPSCSQSGIKIVFDHDVTIAAGDRLGVTLTFDRNRVLWSTDKGFVLSPVIHAEVTTLPM